MHHNPTFIRSGSEETSGARAAAERCVHYVAIDEAGRPIAVQRDN